MEPKPNPFAPSSLEAKPADPNFNPPPQTSSYALWSMILGISSFFCSLLTGLPAVVLGVLGLRQIGRSQGRVSGSGMATAGIVTGGVGTLVSVCFVGGMVALMLPAIQVAREAARLNQCKNNLRELGVAAYNHEGVYRRFPLATDSPHPLHVAAPGGNEPENRSGYSWTVKLLPFIEEKLLFDNIANSSDNLSLGPFDKSVAIAGGPAETALVTLTCPSFVAEVDATPAEYQGLTPAFTNYVATAGTRMDKSKPGVVTEDGVLISAADNQRGIKISQLVDGATNTLLIAESRERRYNSWYDGQTAWVVGLLPEGNADEAALNVGGKSTPYLPANRWTGRQSRLWGPSSMHADGAVNHLFADGHIQTIRDHIDPEMYSAIITRHGGEEVSMPSGL